MVLHPQHPIRLLRIQLKEQRHMPTVARHARLRLRQRLEDIDNPLVGEVFPEQEALVGRSGRGDAREVHGDEVADVDLRSADVLDVKGEKGCGDGRDVRRRDRNPAASARTCR